MADTHRRVQLEQFLNRQDFEAFLDALTDHLPGRPGSRTRANVLSSLRAFLRWADHEWRGVLSPTPELLPDYLAHLACTVTAITAKNHLSRLRHLYTALRHLDVLDQGVDPFAHAQAPAHDFNSSRDAYTDDELDALLAHSDSEGRALILLGAHAGLSARQVLALHWHQIRWQDGTLWIQNRPVVDGTQLRDALNRLNAATLGTTPTTRVFAFDTPDAVRKVLFLTCLRAGVPTLKWQPLRTHAALRAVRALGPQALASLNLHGERSYWALHTLARQDVLQGPKRRGTQQ